MKTFFVSLVTVIAVMYVCVWAISTAPKWEAINAVEIKGGECYAFTTQQCTGGTIDCENVYCTSTDGGQTWACNSGVVTVKTGSTYASSCPETEAGGWTSCISGQYECSQAKFCSSSCTKNGTTGIYYCSGTTLSMPNNVTRYFPEDINSQCN